MSAWIVQRCTTNNACPIKAEHHVRSLSLQSFVGLLLLSNLVQSHNVCKWNKAPWLQSPSSHQWARNYSLAPRKSKRSYHRVPLMPSLNQSLVQQDCSCWEHSQWLRVHSIWCGYCGIDFAPQGIAAHESCMERSRWNEWKKNSK
jgi:hypothetical protein